jgi:hypothetical protein
MLVNQHHRGADEIGVRRAHAGLDARWKRLGVGRSLLLPEAGRLLVFGFFVIESCRRTLVLSGDDTRTDGRVMLLDALLFCRVVEAGDVLGLEGNELHAALVAVLLCRVLLLACVAGLSGSGWVTLPAVLEASGSLSTGDTVVIWVVLMYVDGLSGAECHSMVSAPWMVLATQSCAGLPTSAVLRSESRRLWVVVDIGDTKDAFWPTLSHAIFANETSKAVLERQLEHLPAETSLARRADSCSFLVCLRSSSRRKARSCHDFASSSRVF